MSDNKMKLTLLMATTLDGKIARGPNHFVDWTGKSDKKYFAKLTKEVGVIIMGSKTYDTIGKPLPGRLNVVMTNDKDRGTDCENLMFTSAEPIQLLKELAQLGYKEAVLIGGTTINTLFAKEITHVYLTVVPKIFGTGLDLFCKPLNMDLDLISVQTLGEDGHILVRCSVNNG